MGVSPVKVPNVYTATVFNGPQNNNSNYVPINPSNNNKKNSTDNLRIIHQNIRGLHRKFDELTTQRINFFPIYFALLSII